MLAVLFITAFIIPVASRDLQGAVFGMGFTIIFILSAFSVTYIQKRVAVFALAVIVVEWVSRILNMPLLMKLALPVKFIFFLLIVAILIVQIAKAQKVTMLVMLQSISVYLLLGLCFSVIVALLESIYPNSFNFQRDTAILNKSFSSDFIYFTFVSFTSTGYGDFLPLTPAAKSLSNLISITGQLYIAIIISMLVGKYSSK